MAKRGIKGTHAIMLALAVLAVGFGAFYLGQGNALSIAGTSHNAGTVNVNGVAYKFQSQNINQVAPASSCQANVALQYEGVVQYPDYTKSPVSYSPVSGQTISGYPQSVQGSTVATLSATSTSSAVAVTGVQPCTPYLLVSGDNSGYFVNYTYANLQQTNDVPVYINVQKYTAPTLTVSNSSITTPTTTTRIHSVTASSTQVAYVFIKAGQYTASQQNLLVSLSFNSLAIQSLSFGNYALANPLGGAPSMSFISSNTSNPSYTSLGVQNTQNNYVLPSSAGLANFNYATGSGQSITATGIPVTIKTSSAYATNELIGVQVTPGTSFFDTSTGMMDSPVYRNPLTSANLFTPVQTDDAIALTPQ